MRRSAGAIVAVALVASSSSCLSSEPTAALPPTAPPSPTATKASSEAVSSPTSSPSAVASSAPPAPAIVVEPVDAGWTRAIDGIVAGRPVSVAVGVSGRLLYVHRGSQRRIPASGQKLLTSMAALDLLGRGHRFPTVAAAATRPDDGVVRDDLWLVGGGDPELSAARLAQLASSLHAAGLRRITGAVIGDTSTFSRRWWAPGWVEGISRSYVRRPTALVFEGNLATRPELAAAASLTTSLRGVGIRVGGDPRTGAAPTTLRELARLRSAPLSDLVARQNHGSLNLHAEVLLRAIGVEQADAGTTAAGAEQVVAWARSAGADVRVRDGSGLSHGDAVSAVDLVALLLAAADERWGPVFEASLPAPGQGTLRGRLAGAPIRAKTGTLFTVPCSVLAGYGRDAAGRRFTFAVLSEGITKASSIAIEDAVVRVLTAARIG